MNDLVLRSLYEQSELLKSKAITATELFTAYSDVIHLTEPTLNSFITLTLEEGLIRSKQISNQIQRDHYVSPLHGIPIGLKDLFDTAGIKTTSGSKIFDSRIPETDSTVAAKLNAAGAILIGKLNMHPFAYGPTGENEDYGHMHNPWNPNKLTGGSSGGSGSAVAIGQCSAALGSDTGGSVRIPASLCGIVGFKPTYGLISKFGVTALSWSLDHPGPLTRTVEDSILVMNEISGLDPQDPSTVESSPISLDFMNDTNLKSLKIGVPKQYFHSIDPAVGESVTKAIEVLKQLGAEIIDVEFPLFDYSEAISACILMAEATSYHRELLKTNADEIYEPVRLRLQTGLFISNYRYLQAQRLRTLFTKQMHALMSQVDVLVGPTEPIVAPDILSKTTLIDEETVGITSALTRFNRPYNITGFPAISVPCGFSDDSLPIGLQIAGAPFSEYLIAKVAYAYQESTSWKNIHPKL
jgi:aspartyl-tRNA(Asn)/glutamyl-tRNA(Gln) amidotransferase subunit A